MDGLELEAEAEAQRLIQRLYTHERLEISHSSRDRLMQRITNAMIEAATTDELRTTGQRQHDQIILTKVLVLRSGVSVQGLAMLKRALEAQARQQNKEEEEERQQQQRQQQQDDSSSSSSTRRPRHCMISELEFVGLRNVAEVSAAIACCRCQGVRISRLRLDTYYLDPFEAREPLIHAIRQGIFGTKHENMLDDAQELMTGQGEGDVTAEEESAASDSSTANTPLAHLETFELVGYPVGTVGAQILVDAVSRNTKLHSLKLMDCDLRSDAAKYIAQMIRYNKHLYELDLSYNRHYLGSPLTREMTLKTLFSRGLRYNLTLQELGMQQIRGEPIRSAKIDQQLAINRFRHEFVQRKLDHFAIPLGVWATVLGRVSAKPAALHLMLCDGSNAVFSNHY